MVENAIDALCADLVADGVAPTATAGWAARRGDQWEVSVGGATRAIFDLASVTKPITALTLARSSVEGATPLRKLLPEAEGTPCAEASVELLLAHRAGLEAHVSLYRELAEGRPFDRAAALMEALRSRRPECVGPIPAKGFAPVYSDLGYALVGEAMKRRDVPALDLGPEIGSASALRAANVDFDARVVPTEIVAWRGGEIRGQVHDENAWALNGDGLSGHAGMFGTIDAVLRFGTLAHDAIASDASLEWLVRPRPGGTLRAGFDGKSEEGSSAGSRCGARTYGHLGFTGTSLWIDPDAQVVVALLTNRVHPTRENTKIRAARPRIHDALFALAAAATNG